ncbi:unnamed protein product [Rhizoctonia solani]|uniref:Uncharacterized protein n=1 Tax=Rhizoctonia solani TaxID=456999 RepID=A0A8H2X635_9AGAM|nr:unnamed protein product [Rhizoctonia solani]
MASYASSPRPTGAPSSRSTGPAPDSTFQALSQSPSPTIREILGAYSSKGEGDREMLVALLNAKSAEDQRVAAMAALQQTTLQMQHSLAVAQAQAAAPQPPQQLPSPLSNPSPLMMPASAPYQRASRGPAPSASRPLRSPSPRHEYHSRAHPYTHARPHDPIYTAREGERTSRHGRPPMSSRRSPSEEGSEWD